MKKWFYFNIIFFFALISELNIFITNSYADSSYKEAYQLEKIKAQAAINEGDFELTLAISQKMLEIAENANDKHKIVDALIHLSAARRSLKQEDQAIDLLKKANELIQQGYGKRHEKLVTASLAKIRFSMDALKAAMTKEEKFKLVDQLYTTGNEHQEAVPYLIQFLNDDFADLVQLSAFVLSTNFTRYAKPAVPKLLELMLDENPKTAKMAALSLANISDPASLDTLIGYLSIPDHTIQALALAVLTEYKENLDSSLSYIFKTASSNVKNVLIEFEKSKLLYKKGVLKQLQNEIYQARINDPSFSVRHGARVTYLIDQRKMSLEEDKELNQFLKKLSETIKPDLNSAIKMALEIKNHIPDIFINDPCLLIDLTVMLGERFADKNKFETAISFYEKTLDLINSFKTDDAVLDRLYVNLLMGDAFLRKGKVLKNEKDIAIGKNLIRSSLDPYLNHLHEKDYNKTDEKILLHIIESVNDLGQNYYSETELEKFAKLKNSLPQKHPYEIYEKALTLGIIEKKEPGIEYVLKFEYAKFLFNQGRFSESDYFFRKAYQKLETLKEEQKQAAYSGFMENHLIYATALVKMNKLKKAYEIYEYATMLEKSLLNAQPGSFLSEEMGKKLLSQLREYSIEHNSWRNSFIRSFGNDNPEWIRKSYEYLENRKGFMLQLYTATKLLNLQQSIDTNPGDVTIANISKNLPENACIIDFVLYKDYNFSAATHKDAWGENRYAVYIVLPDKQVHFQDLGPAEDIDHLISQYRQNISQGNMNTNRQMINISKRIFQKLFDNNYEKIKEYSVWILVPDGNLGLLPFETLTDPDQNSDINQRNISYATSGRVFKTDIKLNTNKQIKIAILADPDYDSEPEPSHQGRNNNDLRNQEFMQQMRSVNWSSLPGTLTEALTIKKIAESNQIQVDSFTGRHASKKNLFGLNQADILHIATHGFFIPENTRMISSGLVLSGANSPNNPLEGIVTAQEIANDFNFAKPKIVVLSACETGLGSIMPGEGIFGLQRAFFLNGTKALIVSLWKVPDIETQQLMSYFYQNLVQGDSADAALRKAKNKLKTTRPHPFYWAAFILIRN